MTVPAPGQAAGAGRDYRRLSPLTPLVRSFIVLVAVAATSWDNLPQHHLGALAWLLLAVLVGGAAYGTVSWLRTKYWIEADELRVDTGVVVRQSRRIRVDRLQGIDIAQPFVARLFGLAELRMDVAGGGRREGSLAFVRLSEAQDLRAVLLSRRDAVRARLSGEPGDHRAHDDEAGDPEPGRAAVPAPVERVVAQLSPGVLVVSLLLSADTITFVLAGVALGVVTFLGGLGGGVSVLPVLLGLGATVVRRLSAFYGFTVSESPAGLQVRRGLLERDTSTITLARVQGVVLTEPLLWRALGWARLDVSVAGYARDERDGRPSASTVMPVASRALVLELARTLLADAGGPDLDDVVLTAPPTRARWAAPVRRRFLRAGVGEDLVVSRSGVLNRRTHAVPHARVQSLRLHQGPWQRRLGLADVLVDSPPGPVSVRARHRDVGEARDLLDREIAASRPARRGAVATGAVATGQPRVDTSQVKSPRPPSAVSSAADDAVARPAR